MWCAINDQDQIIAVHDNKRVIHLYIKRITMYHPEVVLFAVRIKKKLLNETPNLDDLYLVRYGKTYLQAGYLIYVKLVSEQITEDHKFARDILYRILEVATLTKKETKQIGSTIKTLSRIIDDEEQYTPSFSELQSLKMEYDPYMYNKGTYDFDTCL